ncbi:hypothetical protein EDB19DRAFT_2028493 [Suillus lakei]|nr:hypothetical protein EDB19DRAFT_2028493 [Suillus lakei]
MVVLARLSCCSVMSSNGQPIDMVRQSGAMVKRAEKSGRCETGSKQSCMQVFLMRSSVKNASDQDVEQNRKDGNLDMDMEGLHESASEQKARNSLAFRVERHWYLKYGVSRIFAPNNA